jgi:hypothetical protein
LPVCEQRQGIVFTVKSFLTGECLGQLASAGFHLSRTIPLKVFAYDGK